MHDDWERLMEWLVPERDEASRGHVPYSETARADRGLLRVPGRSFEMTMSPGAGSRHSTIPDIAKAMLPRCTGLCAAWADSRAFRVEHGVAGATRTLRRHPVSRP